MVSLPVLLLAPLLGIDNLVGAIGVASISRTRRTWIETCLSFGFFAAAAVIAGTIVGAYLAQTLAHVGRFVAGLIIAFLGVRALWPATAEAARPSVFGMTLGSIIALGATLSSDTLAASVALGATHSAQGALPIITGATVCMTVLGFALGAESDRFPVGRKRVTGLLLLAAAYGVAGGWI